MSGIKKMRAAVLILGCLLLTGMFAGCGRKKRRLQIRSAFIILIKKKRKSRQWKKSRRATRFPNRRNGVFPQLKENPVELSLRSPISGFAINSWNVKDDQLVLDMSVEYKKAVSILRSAGSGCNCAHDDAAGGISYVSVTVGGEALTDSLGNVVGPYDSGSVYRQRRK